MKKYMKILMLATRMMIICSLAALGVLAREKSDEGACSNKTLQGDYGFAIEGLILPAPGVALPIRGVNMTRYDGNGTFTSVDHIVLNGVPISGDGWTAGAGTYHVNADCTGTAQINGTLNLRFVVVKQGKEIHAVVTAPFDGPVRTVSSVGIKVE